MVTEEYLKYWESLYGKNDFFGTGPTKLAIYANNIIKEQKIQKMLEIGCGQGRDIIYFASKGYNVNGFDLSHNAIAFVEEQKKELELENIKLMTHDTSKAFSYDTNQFDFVYSNLALQFFDLSTMNNIIKEISRVMKNGASFIFSTKKEGDKYYKTGKKINENAYQTKGVIRYFFNKESIMELLKKEFNIIEMIEDKHTNLDSSVSVWWKIHAIKK